MSEEKLNVGVPDEQLAQEAEESLRIQNKRLEQGDAHMQLQVNRSAMTGDIESMSQEQRDQLFNPDGTLSEGEVYERMLRYVQEHQKVGFESHELRKQVAGVGQDQRTGQWRMPNPGEKVNDSGLIEMVDPKYADQVAQKMRDADEVDVKNSFQRSKLMNEVVMQVMNRVNDPIGAVHISFDESRKLVAQYHAERQAGWPRSRHDFLPLSEYMQQLAPRQLPNGTYTRPLREILANECGVFQMGTQPTSRLRGKIVCVKDKDMTQNLNVQVTVPKGFPQAESTSTPLIQTQPTQSSTTIVSPGQPRAEPQTDETQQMIAKLPPPPPGFKGST